jgi:hypothetical protein
LGNSPIHVLSAAHLASVSHLAQHLGQKVGIWVLGFTSQNQHKVQTTLQLAQVR